MTAQVKLIALVKRKKGFSHEEFVRYYEERHVPLIMSLVPFCTQYRRNYFTPGKGFSPFPTHGDQEYDVVTEVVYPDLASFERMQNAVTQSSAGQTIAADEEQFVDRTATIMWLVDERVTPIAG